MKKTFILFLFLVYNVFGQFNDFDPSYDWYTIKSGNIYVHFHEEAERTARTVLKIAEDVWKPITSLYNYEPKEAHYIIKDIDDYSNGATYFFDNKIEIWASALDFDLRGTHNWLRNVISHEFTHLVQIQAGMKLSRTIPAFYLQFLNYEDKRRPDILYGYPNFIASYPVATFNIPAWFAEGTAQYMRAEFNYDNWDTHRDMILRSYALDNKMLTWNEMGSFGKTSLGNESVYNSGFALTRYISQKYGEDKLREITYKLGKLGNFTIDAAFEDVLGKDGNQIYDEWSSFLKGSYQKRIAKVKENLIEGKKIFNEGFGNFYPIFSQDGRSIYFISNSNNDYLGLSDIYKYSFKTKKIKLIKSQVRSTFSFIKGQNKIVYAKLTNDNPNWKNIHDLYAYDLETEEETRLTHGLRANNPCVSHNGKSIVFVYQKDGTSNIGIVNVDGSDYRSLTLYNKGEQVHNPKFSLDDKSIIFGYSYHHGRDIAKVNLDGSGRETILKTNADERNAVYFNENEIIYSSDATGIFNIYKYNLKTKENIQLTNVLGGAFMPAVNKKGDVAYAGYTSSGYKIFLVEFEETKKVNPNKKYVIVKNPPLDIEKRNGDLTKADFAKLTNFNDYELPKVKKEKYGNAFTDLSVLPFIRFDNYNTSNSFIDKIKPGVYLTSSDMLNRYAIFAGGSINTRFERDLFFNFVYRNKLPLLYSLGLKPEVSLDIFSISRKSDADIIFGQDKTTDPPTYEYKVNTDVTYNLFEVDLAFNHKIFNPRHNLELRFIYSKYTAAIGSFLLADKKTLYPSSSDDYFLGRNLQLTYSFRSIYPNVDADINPLGLEIEAKYNYEFNKYNNDSEYKYEDGVLVPLYNNFNFHKVELNLKNHMYIIKDHTLSTYLRVGSILGKTVPDFFDFYLGGLVGMKSYPFYAVSGNELAWLNLTYRFPIFKHIDYRLGLLYLDKLFFSVHGDIGNAWNGSLPSLNKFKKGAGLGLRFKMTSFYLFPTSLFFNASYSFDKFSKVVREKTVVYGKEWRFYGGILFDFNF
ncbi:MAG: biopolymer transporter Tol [Ignavibacteriae bacterium]|nr:MAG: biopolymer transporter Tol [Ignavibacteriota bacterium]